MNRKELDGMFGMWEMEACIESLLQKSERQGTPFHRLIIQATDFQGRELTGFCQLLYRRYFQPIYPNSDFGIHLSLVERMRQREVWRDMPDPPDYIGEFCNRMTMGMRGI